MDIFRVRHETVYSYKSPVAFGEHRMMLRPRDSLDQRIVDYRLEISPAPAKLSWSEDPSGNVVGLAAFRKRACELAVVATMRVERAFFSEDYLAIAPHAAALPFSYGIDEGRDLARFIERQYADDLHLVDRWARDVLVARADRPARGGTSEGTWGFLKRMNALIRRDFAYRRREEPGIQPPTRTLRTRSGSCRDFAVLMIEACRTVGLAARFVSGYLHVRESDGRTSLAGGSTHAWLQVYLPGGGWIDFDPTSGAVGNRDLVRVAVVRDPALASPLGGTFMGFPDDYRGMSVRVDVVPDTEHVAPAAAAG